MKRWLQQGKELSHQNRFGLFSKAPVFFYCFFFLLSVFVFSQQRITGKVSSGDSAIAGATVQVKKTRTATAN